mgnify:CR=1 FL=1
MTMSSFELENIEIHKGGRCLLQVPSLEIPAKGITGLLGPNGVGKSSLMKILMALDHPKSGQVRFLGKNIESLDSKFLSQHIAWVPSNSSLSFDVPVHDLVLLGRYPWHQGFPKSEDLEIAAESLERLGLSHLKNRYAQSLSSGEWQKVQIARALASQVKCIILDEPCAHLDLRARFELMELLVQLSTEQCAVLISSHDQYLMPRYLSHHVALKDGGIFSEGPGALSPESISRLFDLSGFQWDRNNETSPT